MFKFSKREEQYQRRASSVLGQMRAQSRERKQERSQVLLLEFSGAALGMAEYSHSVSTCFSGSLFLHFT